MPKHRRDIIKFTPHLKNKTTPIRAGIRIIESKIGQDKSTSKFSFVKLGSESIIIIKEGIRREIETIDVTNTSFFEICFTNGFK